jgi:pimeloyl-ACP methyl ester carboxylesterase
MALDQPQRVSRLILMSGYYYPRLRADLPLLSWPALPLIGRLWRHTIMPLLGRVMAGRAERQLFAPAPVARRFLKQFPLALSLRPSQLRASSAEAGLMLLDAARLSTRYAELSLPITILAGDGDRLVSPARQSERLHEALPQSEYLVLPETGHMTHYVLHALRSTLAAVRAPTSRHPAGEMTQQETAAWRESSE